MAEKNNKQTDSGKPKGKGMFIGLLVAGLVIGIGLSYVLLTNSSLATKFNEQNKEKELFSSSLDEFVINTADPNYRRYLKTNLVLEYSDKKIGEELEKKKYKVRDAIINLLASKSVDDIRTLEGKNSLKTDLIEVINTNLENGKIENLFWTEFVVQ